MRVFDGKENSEAYYRWEKRREVRKESWGTANTSGPEPVPGERERGEIPSGEDPSRQGAKSYSSLVSLSANPRFALSVSNQLELSQVHKPGYHAAFSL